MAITLRETIKLTVRDHILNNKGKVYGQCLTAVGWVGGTLPELFEEDGMVELSMADVAGGAIVVGAALSGSRPIYVVRYQGFQWYNCVSIVNYAAKSKEIWKRPCPVLVRSIAMEGAIGPVAGSSHHSLYYRMPGLKIVAPMTPNEYKTAYEEFMNDDIPYYFSEHRKSFDNSEDLDNIVYDKPDITLVPFSITRFAAQKASEILLTMGIKCNVLHQFWIKPLRFDESFCKAVSESKYGCIVLDDDYTSGISESVAYKIMKNTKSSVECMGLQDKTAGFNVENDNLPPNEEQIIKKVIDTISKLK
jgi:pyruvate/2-oxoglutarate/acetoin dehydrogenase E1 component